MWMDERILVGRLDESDGHVVLSTWNSHWTIIVGKIKSGVQDPALSQAELLRLLRGYVPVW